MTKTIRIAIALVLTTALFTACKSKQKVTKISGAQVEATTPVAPQINPNAAAVQKPTAASTPEVTRNERFSLAEGETNADALKSKYHVVVGSFKSQVNAKGLQSTLKSEGNNALLVINEQGMYRVLIASFNDYSQARVRINQISTRFPDAWVLVQK